MKKFSSIEFFNIFLTSNIIYFLFLIKGSKSSLSSFTDQNLEIISSESISEKDLQKQKVIIKDRFSHSLINNNALDDDVFINFFLNLFIFSVIKIWLFKNI
jgi:hypothetical protein